MILSKPLTYALDTIAGMYFLKGIITSNEVVTFIGGIAAVLAAINHYQQIKERKKKKQ